MKDFALAPPSPDCLYDERGWECGWKICASYNAKNSYGAYIGARVYVYLLRGPNFWAGGSLDNGQCPAYIDPTQDWKD